MTDGEWEEGPSGGKEQHVQICQGGNIQGVMSTVVLGGDKIAWLGCLSRALQSDLWLGSFLITLLHTERRVCAEDADVTINTHLKGKMFLERKLRRLSGVVLGSQL